MKILVATKNKGKLKEFVELLKPFDFKILSLDDFNSIEEPVEDGKTLMENAIIKAFYYYNAFKVPVISDDSGLFVDELFGEPGIYSARYSGKGEKSNREKLLQKLIGKTNRSAHFECNLVFYDGVEFITSVGSIFGKITEFERGNNGFGYDSIFLTDKYNLTMAELDEDIKNSISHRFNAIQGLIFKLNFYLNKINKIDYAKELYKELVGVEPIEIKLCNAGMSNYTFLLKGIKNLVIRIPGYSSEIFILRSIELEGLNKVKGNNDFIQYIYYDVLTGVKVSPYIVESNSNLNLNDILNTLKVLHKMDSFINDYKPFDRLNYYERLTNILNIKLDNSYYEVLSILNEHKDKLISRPIVPCHNDCQLSNFINNVLIDFEFIGNNDPLFDYACFGNNDISISLSLVDLDDEITNKNDAKNTVKLWYSLQALSWYLVALFKARTGFSKSTGIDFEKIAYMFLNKSIDVLNN